CFMGVQVYDPDPCGLRAGSLVSSQATGSLYMKHCLFTARARDVMWIVMAPAFFASGCGSDAAPDGLAGTVTDTAREPVANATVSAIPASLVAGTPVTATDVMTAKADDFDEPLEGLIDSMGETLPSTLTDRDGDYSLSLPPDTYYFYVVPDATDSL